MKYKDYVLPEDVKYHKEHCWLKDIGNGQALIGWTDFAQKLAQDITAVFVPEMGQEIKKDQYMGSIETGKWVGKVYAPVDAKVLKVNQFVIDDPRRINQDPYDKGWVLKVSLTSPDQVKSLLKAQDYIKVIDAKLKELNL